MPKLFFLVAEDWYFVSHRLPLAIAAREQGFDVTVVTRVSTHRATLEKAGIKTVPFEMARQSVSPVAILREALQLARLYRREQPDIVHHVALRSVIVGALAARLAGVRGVVSAVTGLGYMFATEGRHTWARTLVKRGLRLLLSEGVTIVQNPEDRDFLERLGVSEARLRLVLGVGVDPERFQPGGSPKAVPVVMLASRLLWDKGVGEFVEAARRLTGRARFVLVGAPDPENPAAVSERQLETWAKQGVVEWWGFQQNMPHVLRQATIFCLPSYREGMPKALLEAMATGLACVTSDAPGCRDAVEDGVSGLLVPARNADALATAIDRLLSDAVLRTRLGLAARARAVERFNAQRVVTETLQIYRDLMP